MKKITPYLLSFGFTVLVLILHVNSSVSSMLNDFSTEINQEYLSYVVEYHEDNPVFANRVLTTSVIRRTSEVFHIQVGSAFIFVNFILLFISSILLYHVSLFVTKNEKFSWLSIGFYFLTFSNLFAFYDPIYTYDEPMQYCMLLAALLFLLKEKWFLYFIFLSAGLVARETSALLIPFFALFFINRKTNFVSALRKNKDYRRKSILITTPILVYIVYYLVVVRVSGKNGISADILHSRLSLLRQNFFVFETSAETVAGFLTVLLFPIYIIGISKDSIRQKYLKFKKSFVFLMIINTIIVIVSTQAKEARLFALPLIFIWPIMGELIWKNALSNWTKKSFLLLFYNLRISIALLGLIYLSHFFSFDYFYTQYEEPVPNWFSQYMFTILIFIATDYCLKVVVNAK